jgi:hypothetical protein
VRIRRHLYARDDAAGDGDLRGRSVGGGKGERVGHTLMAEWGSGKEMDLQKHQHGQMCAQPPAAALL